MTTTEPPVTRLRPWRSVDADDLGPGDVIAGAGDREYVIDEITTTREGVEAFCLQPNRRKGHRRIRFSFGVGEKVAVVAPDAVADEIRGALLGALGPGVEVASDHEVIVWAGDDEPWVVSIDEHDDPAGPPAEAEGESL